MPAFKDTADSGVPFILKVIASFSPVPGATTLSVFEDTTLVYIPALDGS